MPALQVRDFPEDLYEELKNAADRDRRSIAQQTTYLVEQALHRHPAQQTAGYPASGSLPAEGLLNPGRVYETEASRQARIEKRRGVFARIDRLPETILYDAPDPAVVVRQMREERDDQLMEAIEFPFGRKGVGE